MRYKAFLSYSHAADRERAAALHTALHRFAKPWYRIRAIDVFRDQTNLAATPELWPTIRAALDDSEFFVLLASPEAAASPWVTREIEHWCATRSSATLLIVLTSGAIAWNEGEGDFDWKRTTALPRTMSGRYPAEPLWIDLSWATAPEQFSLRHLRFRDAVATLAAPLHGRSKEELDGEDIRQHKRTMLVVRATVVVLALLVALFYWQYRVAESRRRVGLSRQLAAEVPALLDDHYDRALLLGVQALHFSPTLEARNALFSALAATPHASTFLHGGRTDVNRLAFSADHATLAVGSVADGDLTLWDLGGVSPKSRTVATGYGGNQFSLAFAPAGDAFATGGKDGVIFWNAKTARPELPRFPAAGADSLTLSADGRAVAFIDYQGSIHLRARTTGAPLTPPIAAGMKQSDPIVLSPDGRLLAAGNGGQVRLWRLGSAIAPPQLLQLQFVPGIHHLNATTPRVEYLGFAGGGTTLVAGTSDGVRLWDIERDRVVGEARAIRTTPFDAPYFEDTFAVSADGRFLAAGSTDGSVRVWNVVEGTPARRLTGHANAVWSLALSADGSRLAVGYQDGVVRLWDLTSHSLGDVVPIDWKTQGLLIFIPHGDQLATADRDGIHLRDRRTMASRRILPASRFDVASLAVDAEGRRLAAGGRDGVVRVWDLASGRLAVPPLTGHRGKVFALTFSADGAVLGSGDSEGGIGAWELTGPPRGKVVRFNVRGTKPPSIYAVAFSGDGKVLFGGSSGGLIVWQRAAGKARISNVAEGLAMAFTAGARLLAAQDYDEALRLWSVARRAALGPPIATVNTVNDLGFSPDGRLLAMIDGGSVLRLFDVASGQRFGPPLVWNKGAAIRTAFRDDGALLAVEEDEAIVTWDLDLGSWQRRARAVANRNLTAEEWRLYIPDDPYERTFPDLP